jgi:hypothetical protein
MFKKSYVDALNNGYLALSDFDTISGGTMPMDANSLVFTPTTMARMESTLIGLDGAFDSDSESYSDDSSHEWASTSSSTAKRQKTSSRTMRQLPGPKSSRRLEDMTPEEIARRQRRRERNKAAAARCRQRRVDITNQLLTETQQLESEGQRLEREIENLRRQRDQLQFVLEAHRPVCRGDACEPVKMENVFSDNMHSMTSMASMAAVRPTSLPLASNMIPITTSDFSFDIGSTGVTPIVSASGLNLFLGPGADFMSPTALLASPSSLTV